MVVPSGGGCCCGPKPAKKKTATTKKPATKATKSSKSSPRKSDDALKKRVKKALEKEYVSTAKAKKEGAAKSTKKTESAFKKVDKNQPSTSGGSTAASKKSTGLAAPKKSGVKKTATTTTTKKTAASGCSGGSCGVVKKTTVKKSTAKKPSATSTGTKRKTVTKTVTARKTASAGAARGCGGGCGCGCGDDSTDDSCDGCCDEDDSDDYDSYSTSSFTSYSDSDDDDFGCCGGGRDRCQSSTSQCPVGKGKSSSRTGKSMPKGGKDKQQCKEDKWEIETIKSPVKLSSVGRRMSWLSDNLNDSDRNLSADDEANGNLEASLERFEEGEEGNHCKTMVAYMSNGNNDQSSTDESSEDFDIFRSTDTSNSSDNSWEHSSDIEEEVNEEEESEHFSYEDTSSEVDSNSKESSTDDCSHFPYYESGSNDDHDLEYTLPEGVEEDVIIRRGDAIMHAAEGVKFDSDTSMQIFEISDEVVSTKSVSHNSPQQKQQETANSSNEDEESDDSRAQLEPVSSSNEAEESDNSRPKLETVNSSNEAEESDYSRPELETVSSSNDDKESADSRPKLETVDSSSEAEESHNSRPKLETVNSSNEDKESDDGCPQLVPIDLPKTEFFELSKSSSSSEDESSSCSDSFDMSSTKPSSLQPEIFQMSSIFSDDEFIDNIFKGSSPINQNTDIHEILAFKSPMNVAASPKVVSVVSALDQSSPETKGKKRRTSMLSSSPSPEKKKSKPSEALSSSTDHTQSDDEQVETQSKFYNSLNSCQVILLLKTPIYFYGALKIKLLAGAADCFGYNLPETETVEAFSVRGNNLLFLKPQLGNDSMTKEILKIQLEVFENEFLVVDIEEILDEFDATSMALILLERNDRSKKLEMIKKYMRENVFPTVNPNFSGPFYLSEYQLHCRLYVRPPMGLVIDFDWNFLGVTNTSKVILIGGKGVGKSTFLRYTINRNLQKFPQFLLIDLDIGQPETFHPQTISATLISRPLLGPGYFYDLKPFKSYLFGDINIIMSPFEYITAVKKLLKDCDENNKFKKIPWIVNTMGYNRGFGSELLSVIFEHLQPTDVVQLHSRKQFNNFAFEMTADNVRALPRSIFTGEQRLYVGDYNFMRLKSLAPIRNSNRPSDWDMSPKDIRMTMIVTALGSLLAENDDWLTDVVPYCISLNSINIVCCSTERLNRAELLDVINGNLVYLCNNSQSVMECFGIGIVRGVDHLQQNLYLLPSVYPEILRKVNTLAVGNIPLPTSILLNQGPRIKGHVPYTYDINDSISSKHVPKNIYRPKSFLQGPRNIYLIDSN